MLLGVFPSMVMRRVIYGCEYYSNFGEKFKTAVNVSSRFRVSFQR